MFSLINENTTSSLFWKIGIDQERINRLSDENGLFSNASINASITSSANRASHSLSDIGFKFENAALTSSAISGSLTASVLTHLQHVATEVQENIFYEEFYIAWGTKIGHEGIDGNFEENVKHIDFFEDRADNKLLKVNNLLSQSRGDNPKSIPGFFHVVGGSL